MSKAFIIDGYLFHWDMGPQSRVAEPVIAHEPLSPMEVGLVLILCRSYTSSFRGCTSENEAAYP